MSAAAERALRILGSKLREQGTKVPAHKGLLFALACAHDDTAKQLEAERLAREARLAPQPGDPKFNPKAKRPHA